LARTPAPFNFRGTPIKSKDGITQIANWKKMVTQSRQVAKRLSHASSAPPWDFKGAALG
jgi:hypothetical protein